MAARKRYTGFWGTDAPLFFGVCLVIGIGFWVLSAAIDARTQFELGFQSDMNGDGLQTIGDVLLWAKILFFWPGDSVIALLMAHGQDAPVFLEVGHDNFHGWAAGLLSLFIWLPLLVATQA